MSQAGVTETALEARWQRAVRALGARELDALYMGAGANFQWLVGRTPYSGGLPVWLSALILTADGRGTAVVSDMHAEIFSFEGTGVDEVITYADGDDTAAVLRKALRSTGLGDGARVGVEDTLPFGDASTIGAVAPGVRLERAQDVFDALRSVKDAAEIELLRRSGAAVDAAYEAARQVTRPGQSLAESGAAMYKAMIESGCSQPIVSGTYRRYRERTLQAGDMLDLDLGANFSGYAVDTARNLFLGEPSAEVRAWHELLERAYEAAADASRPGTPVSAVHDACAEVLAAAGKRQSWKVGHGVGLAPSHEAPLLQPGNETPLEEGMVFTIDPGFFLEQDEPLHIEETVLVTAGGAERLTSFPLSMLVV
jgi:Xaa-Pro aminopeptidase